MNSCPICGKSSKFKDIPRPSSICPLCGSTERDRLNWLFVRDHTNIFYSFENPSPSVRDFLHIAPEECLGKVFKYPIGSGYVSIDKSSKKAMFNMDITNLQFKDESFDAVFCSHVLEHVTCDILAMKEIKRVLRPDGWAIINVPISDKRNTFEDVHVRDPLERKRLFGQNDHVRIYGKDYITRLRSSGFFVEEIKAKDFIKKSEQRKMGISKEAGSIFFCRKKES